MPVDLLFIKPEELQFPFEVKRQASCCLQLVNTTEKTVAFKVKTTSPKKYCVRPNTGLVLPGATRDVTVTMQPQDEAPPDMQCKDKFLVQSVTVPDNFEEHKISQDLFNKESGKEVSEMKLKVSYTLPSSLLEETAGNGTEPGSLDHLDRDIPDERDSEDLKARLAEKRALIARLTEEKKAALWKAEQLQDDITSFKSKLGGQTALQQRQTASGFSFLFLLAIGLIGLVVGYFLRS